MVETNATDNWHSSRREPKTETEQEEKNQPHLSWRQEFLNKGLLEA